MNYQSNESHFMNSDQVAQYLLDNPEFFEEHLETLMEITLSHPHGGRTISLSERQVLALREKNKELLEGLQVLVEIAKVNDALQYKVHEFVVAVFAGRDFATLQYMIPHLIREIFAVPHAVLKLWQTSPPSQEVQAFVEAQGLSVCLHHAMPDICEWFGEYSERLRAFAYLPLYAGSASIGIMVLASEDQGRFYPEMDTVYLNRIAEVISAALHPYLEQQ